MRAPINSVKHYVQFSKTDIASGASGNLTLALAVVNTALPVNTSDVKEGSLIKNMYIELWLQGRGSSSEETQFTLCLYKQQGATNAMTFTDLANIMAYDNKKNIMYTSQGVIGGADTQAVPVLRQWIKVPKGKQRMGVGDIWKISVSTLGQVMVRCGFSTYKEYQ